MEAPYHLQSRENFISARQEELGVCLYAIFIQIITIKHIINWKRLQTFYSYLVKIGKLNDVHILIKSKAWLCFGMFWYVFVCFFFFLSLCVLFLFSILWNFFRCKKEKFHIIFCDDCRFNISFYELIRFYSFAVFIFMIRSVVVHGTRPDRFHISLFVSHFDSRNAIDFLFFFFFQFYYYCHACAWFPFFISVDYYVSVELYFIFSFISTFSFFPFCFFVI